MRLLVVEDEAPMADVLRRGLEERGLAVDVASTAEDAAWHARETEYDVIVLDLMLPDRPGFDFPAELRKAGRWAPVLVHTARDGVEDRVRGLDLGADDYLTKPFAFDDLLARIRALMRRGARERPSVLSVGDLTLDPATREVRRSDTSIPLTAKEFALLEFFMRYTDRVISKTALIEHVWDFAFDGDSNVLEVYIGYLRQKIDRPFGRGTLQNVRGAGYQLRDDSG